MSASHGVPMSRGGSHYIHRIDDVPITFVTPTIDEELISTVEIELIAGRNISPEIPEGGREGLDKSFRGRSNGLGVNTGRHRREGGALQHRWSRGRFSYQTTS
ncbi:hypothetical protein [Gracilimonas sp.]|uniref:hypothetical protein n=1 Tax=Gracilimonas sp. TaxID=1974203 RepID=UPI0028717366|nr:hypothetical protein [Gracilimonas sp.]